MSRATDLIRQAKSGKDANLSYSYSHSGGQSSLQLYLYNSEVEGVRISLTVAKNDSAVLTEDISYAKTLHERSGILEVSA